MSLEQGRGASAQLAEEKSGEGERRLRKEPESHPRICRTLGAARCTELEIAASWRHHSDEDGFRSGSDRASSTNTFWIYWTDELQPKCKRVTLSKVSARVSNIPGMIHPDVFAVYFWALPLERFNNVQYQRVRPSTQA